MPNSFWDDLATYCHNLAPVLGPLTQAVGNTADAIHASERRTRLLNAQIQEFRAVPELGDRYLEQPLD